MSDPELTPQVSVIIPTRNRAKMLRRTLSAVLSQRGVAIEVVVVDEASHDGTPSMLNSLDDPRVNIIHHEVPKGLPAARNSGLAIARGTWIAFCDDDDIWSPDKLSVQLEALNNSPGYCWCACGAIWVNSRLEYLRAYEPPPPGDIANLALRYNPLPGGGSGTIVKASSLREIGEFDTSLRWGEDWDLWTRLSLRYPIACVDRPLVAYLVHDQNMSNHSPRYSQDASIIESKYRDERLKRGVRIDNAMLIGAQAEIDLRAHRRIRAVICYFKQAIRGGGFVSLGRACFAAFAPNLLVSRWDHRRYSTIPNGWQSEVDTWIAPLRTVNT